VRAVNLVNIIYTNKKNNAIALMRDQALFLSIIMSAIFGLKTG